ncbi:chorismate-binding protein [Blattabacterium cuenoti]|uniref:chorismate-binding protein n=1 Tax=Blattabacterium cuenoti TaxID=1653831 RepID=UPI00163C9DF0|nr:chorismate-binding protein [Blattabacterium cuenoti]
MQNDEYCNNEKKTKSKKISITKLYKKIIENYHHKNNFVIFKRPHEKKIYLYFNKNEDYKCLNKKYFIIKSFDKNHELKIVPHIIYYADISKNLSNIKNSNYIFHWDTNSNFLTKSCKKKYKNLVKKGIKEIEKGDLKKVVLSRSVKISFHKIYLRKTFQKLIMSYPNALISLCYNIYHGFWIGCTPELLIKFQKKNLLISVLAGTIWENNIWTKKEIKEHNIVVNYIQKILKFYKGVLSIKKTRVKKMGHLKHLETLILFSFFKSPNYNKILNEIYPTPSICGIPKKKSFNFIKENEGYKRNFYTGYIGIVDKESMELYLNLRCAKIRKEKNEITLYAGSGITIDSNVDKELKETENKIKNILSQLVFK